MSLIFATQVTAIATAVLAAFAIVTAWYARRAFLKRSQEVKVQAEQLAEQRKVNDEQLSILGLQAKELQESLNQREREALERRSAQASKVFVREERYASHDAGEISALGTTVRVNNRSQQPVYDVSFRWHCAGVPYTESHRDEPSMPACEYHDWVEVPTNIDPGEFGAFAAFRYRAGVRWRAYPDGRFDEVKPGSEPPSYAAEPL